MSGRGLHIALTDEELALIDRLPKNDVPKFVANELEEAKFGTADAVETDKSWSYIHSALTGTDPDGALETTPPKRSGLIPRLFASKPLSDVGAAKFAIVGTRQLVNSENYYVGLIPADKVKLVSDGLGRLTESQFCDRLKLAHRQFQATGNAEDTCQYALCWFPGLVEFFAAAAKTKKNVIFTVDF